MGKKKSEIEATKPLPEQLKDMLDAVEASEKKTKNALRGVTFHQDAWEKNIQRAEEAIKEDSAEKVIFEQLLVQAVTFRDDYAKEVSRQGESLVEIQGHKKSLSDAYNDLTREGEIASIKDALQSRLRNMNPTKQDTLAIETVTDDVIDNNGVEAFDVDKIRMLIHTVQASLELSAELEGVS